MGGFPASGFTAFPVNSGSSDYYGSSVAMPFYGFRQSPFSLIKTIAFRIVGYDFRHLHTTHGCSVLSIPQLYKMEIQLPRHCTFQLLSCRDKGYAQALAIVQAIQLLPSYTNFHSRNKAACQEILVTSLLPAYNRQQHATLPVLFPKSDKL